MSNILLKDNNSITNITPDLTQLVEAFISSQDVKKSSRATYRRSLTPFFKWLDNNGLTPGNVERVDIIKYRDECLSEGKSTLTASSYLTVVRKFYEWAEANKYYPNVAKGIKPPKRTQMFKKLALTPEQATTLLDHFTVDQTETKRDFAVVNLMLRTGLRTIEVSRALVEDITFKSGKRVLMVHGKGRDSKDEFVILTDKAYFPIRNYLEERGRVSGKEPLFTSTSNNSKGGFLSTRTVSYIAKEALKAIGLDNRHLTAHSLRHTTAVNILRAGGRIEDAQGVLRHASPVTTQIYTRTIAEEMRIKHAPEELLDKVF
jgi:integrase/recombinase XerD